VTGRKATTATTTATLARCRRRMAGVAAADVGVVAAVAIAPGFGPSTVQPGLDQEENSWGLSWRRSRPLLSSVAIVPVVVAVAAPVHWLVNSP